MAEWAATEVVADYVSDVAMAELTGGDEGAEQAKLDRAKRQRQFLKRKLDGKAKDLQPRKRHRRSAYQWLVGLNNQALRRGHAANVLGWGLVGFTSARFLGPPHMFCEGLQGMLERSGLSAVRRL